MAKPVLVPIADDCVQVGGSGNTDPLLMVISQNPSEDDAARGSAFLDKAGTLVRQQLALAGVDPRAIYYTYAVPCPTPRGRLPKDDEIGRFTAWLEAEVNVKRPLFVLLLGRVADKAWTLVSPLVTEGVISVMRIPHPGSVLRNRKAMPAWSAALDRVGKIVNGDADAGMVDVPEIEAWVEGSIDPSSPWIAVDTETTDLQNDMRDVHPVSMQVSDGARARFYETGGYWPKYPHVYLHNAKFDAPQIDLDLHDLPAWDDTMLMAYVLRYPRVGLKVIGPEITGLEMNPITDILTHVDREYRTLTRGPRKGMEVVKETKTKRDFKTALTEDYEAAKEYALLDAVVTSRVARALVPKLHETPSLLKYYQEIEKPIVPILHHMESVGVLIDADALMPLRESLDDAIAFHDAALRQVLEAPEGFNPRAPDQLAAALVRLGLPLRDETKGGNLSVAEAALLSAVRAASLEKLDENSNDAHVQAIIHILRGREYTKLRTTYVQALLRDRDDEGRIHASFNQAVADTNRFSSSGPNLQNIPARGQVGTAIRSAFIAKPGHSFVKTDFSALEVRIFAHLTQDEAMIHAFEQGISPHDLNAERFGVDRGMVKNWYFATIYGAEALRAAQTVGLSQDQAYRMMQLVKKESPAIIEWPQHVANVLTRCGYMETIFGWRNYYPHYFSAIPSESNAALREAANMPVQGSASGIVKKFMIEHYKLVRALGASMVLQVHDEDVVEVPDGLVRDFVVGTVDIVRLLGGLGVSFSVPLDVEVKVGPNWANMKTHYKEGTWMR